MSEWVCSTNNNDNDGGDDNTYIYIFDTFLVTMIMLLILLWKNRGTIDNWNIWRQTTEEPVKDRSSDVDISTTKPSPSICPCVWKTVKVHNDQVKRYRSQLHFNTATGEQTWSESVDDLALTNAIARI